MKAELQTTLNDVLVSVIKGAATAKDFILAETPEVVEQLLMWHWIRSFILFLMLLSVFVLLVLWRRKPQTEATERRLAALEGKGYNGRSEGEDFIVFYGRHRGKLALIPVTAVALMMFATLDWLQILIAPKLYLLEYAASLVK